MATNCSQSKKRYVEMFVLLLNPFLAIKAVDE